MIFTVGTLFFTLFSRKSIVKPGTHGFYRYFVWELILLVYVLIMPHWYTDQHSLHQNIAGILFLISLFLVMAGAVQLMLMGKPDKNRDDVPMVYFEKTTVLITSGIYRYIRHPIYASLFFLCWGFFFKAPSWVALLVSILASAFIIATMRAEEAESIAFFGDDYKAYMDRSKMLVPFIF